jgi:hypothetical protein
MLAQHVRVSDKSRFAGATQIKSHASPRRRTARSLQRAVVNDRSQADATLVDVLIDGFEKNEVFGGFHWRNLPMPDEEAALRKFAELAAEAERWKGTPSRAQADSGRQVVAWPDLEILQAGRGIMVRVRAPWFRWWHERGTWSGDPMDLIYEWLREEAASEPTDIGLKR